MGTVFAQIVVAAVFGACIGLEREFGAQPAGLRTHMLVALGSTLFTVAGADLAHTDPTRVAAQVVTGIGFLGGGAILKEGVNIRGLTTAGSLWVTAAIGLSVGLRQWAAAGATTALTMGVLWLVKVVERDWMPRRRMIEVVLFIEPDAALDQVEQSLGSVLPQAKVRRIDFAGSKQSISITARANAGAPLSSLAEQLRQLQGVHGVELTR